MKQEQLLLIRTNAAHPEFRVLVKQLDAFLSITDGEEHDFYHQFNKLDQIDHVVLGFINDSAVCCGAFKERKKDTVEIKRMYTVDEYRGQGFALIVLEQLEAWAAESGYSRCVLETGIRQTAAVRLYQNAGYQTIPCYGPYKEMDNSRCFEKKLF